MTKIPFHRKIFIYFKKNLSVITRLSKSPYIVLIVLKNYFLFLILKKRVLRNLQLAIIYDCQYKCSLCAAAGLKREKEPLNVEQIKKIIEKIKSLGCINVNLTGGEPLLRTDIDKIVKLIYKSGLMVGLITNGGLIEYNLLKKLKVSGLSEIAISMYGSEEYHDNFTGIKGSYRKAIQSIEIAKRLKLNTIINTIITHDSLRKRCLEDIKIIAIHYSIFIQPILLCYSRKNLCGVDFSLTSEDLESFKVLLRDPYIKSLHRNYFGSTCPAGNEYIYIGAYGDVFMCDLVQTSYGNVLEESLVTIWQRMLASRIDIGHKHLCLGLKNNN